MYTSGSLVFFFFFNDTATPEIYTLPLHDALPIWPGPSRGGAGVLREDHRPNEPRPPAARLRHPVRRRPRHAPAAGVLDRKSTRLNSSHANISYAVFCLKKKKTCQPHYIYYKHNTP